jgi:hypothetical protein
MTKPRCLGQDYFTLYIIFKEVDREAKMDWDK